MRYFLLILLFSLPAYADCEIRPYFSPNGGAEQAIINEINKAQDSVVMAAYVFTSQPISQALELARSRAVTVATVVDGNASKQVRLLLSTSKYSVKYNHKYAIQHSKYIITDDTLITGSFNFTKSAEKRNSENILVIQDCPNVIVSYQKNWSKLWNEAEFQ